MMYGLISKLIAVPGKRAALIDVLREGAVKMPGCLHYFVARDLTDSSAIWVTEIWQDKARHQASLSLPLVQRAMQQGRPLIEKFGERIETEPLAVMDE